MIIYIVVYIYRQIYLYIYIYIYIYIIPFLSHYRPIKHSISIPLSSNIFPLSSHYPIIFPILSHYHFIQPHNPIIPFLSHDSHHRNCQILPSMGRSQNGGTPKWMFLMVFKGKFDTKMDDLGVPPILGKLHISPISSGCPIYSHLSIIIFHDFHMVG